MKSVIMEINNNNFSSPIELKTKKSDYNSLEIGDVSSTTTNFDINYTPSVDSRKVVRFVKIIYLKCYEYKFSFFSLVFCFQTTSN